MEKSGELKSAGVEKWNKAVFKEKAFTCGRERESPLRNRQEAKTGNMVSRFQTTHNRKDVNLDRFPEFETLKFLLLLTYNVSVTSLTEMERGAVQTPPPLSSVSESPLAFVALSSCSWCLVTWWARPSGSWSARRQPRLRTRGASSTVCASPRAIYR